jgi:molybdopterin-binding protein
MKLSARNQIKGKVVEVVKGQTTAHVRIEIAKGTIVTARSPTRPWTTSSSRPVTT